MAATYYVKSGGNDASAGTSDETAWANCPGLTGWTGSATLVAGDIVYFRSHDTWLKGNNSDSDILTPVAGVKYYGNVYGSGTRAKLQASTSLTHSGVHFTTDSATQETVVEGFEIDMNNKGGNGITFCYPWASVNLTGAMKRVKNCIVHGNSPGTTGTWDYGILVGLANSRSISNVEIIDTEVYDTGEEAISIYASGGQSGTLSNVTVRGCTTHNAGVDQAEYDIGIELKNQQTNTIVENNYCYGHSIAGIFLDGSQSTQAGTIRYNKLTGNGNGIAGQDSATKTWEIYGNIIFGNTWYGMVFFASYASSSNTLNVYNNTFYNNGSSAELYINSAANFSSLIVKNNIFFAVSGLCISDSGPEIDTHNNNLYYKSSGDLVIRGLSTYTSANIVRAYEATAQITNPLFTNGAADDFTLQVGSPAINLGANLGTTYRNALDPTSVWPSSVSTLSQDDYESWEIGAYVYSVIVAPREPRYWFIS